MLPDCISFLTQAGCAAGYIDIHDVAPLRGPSGDVRGYICAFGSLGVRCAGERARLGVVVTASMGHPLLNCSMLEEVPEGMVRGPASKQNRNVWENEG